MDPLSDAHERALRELAGVGGDDTDWAVTGSTALALHAERLGVPPGEIDMEEDDPDIDVETDSDGVERFRAGLAERGSTTVTRGATARVEGGEELAFDEVRSAVEGVEVQVLGDFSVVGEDGTTRPVYEYDEPTRVPVRGVPVPVVPLRAEEEGNERTGRMARAEQIRTLRAAGQREAGDDTGGRSFGP